MRCMDILSEYHDSADRGFSMNVQELLQVFLDESNNKELAIYAYMLTGSRDDALDLLSDLLIEILENPSMQNALEPIAYFKTTMKNKAHNKRKRDSRIILYPPEELSVMMGSTQPDSDYENKQSRQEWRNRLLRYYSEELTDAFIKCYVDGYAVKEMATELGMSENALSQQFTRMRKKLKSKLAGALEMMLCLLLRV